MTNEKQGWEKHWGSQSTIERTIKGLKGINTAYPDVVRLLLKLTDEKSKCIELGCGTGTYAIELLANNRNCIASDYSEESLKLAKMKGKRLYNLEIPTQLIDAYNIPYPDNTFELIFSDGVIEHLDVPRVAKEMKRVLKPNGWMVAVVPSGSLLYRLVYYTLSPIQHRPFEVWLSQKQWHDIFTNTGYKNISISLSYNILAGIAMRIRILSKIIQYLPQFGRTCFLIKAQK